ncbi:c-type cytochrome [Pseudemcibacter aquimaris]|uniref:c-type cytochrome n=1 Tax=Pseudemcibacter aquimaris TaxID=2857064 RepID=UPI00201260E6|nr:c-type cytochrome [Pseudemcibacter aquimaris]MCC3860255.1 c-type cytochrome [Pseudemcibacter aquimaris]WDU57580.1 c-type cytochrome [Pseudemcibacter aquimaris]
MKRILFTIILTALFAPIANAQNPFAEPKNLKVLPETVKGDQLRQIMRRFSAAIGENCSYCHDRVETEDGAHMVWDTDNNDKKRVTREMMKLVGHVRQVSANLYPDNPEHKPTAFVCTTCHRGQANPFLIEEVMNNEIASGGTGAAQAKYLELKKEYYGSHTYDFTGFTLAEYANRLIIGGENDNAVEMAKFGTEQFPNEPYAHEILGNAYMKTGNAASAIKAYEASLALDPDQDGVKQAIEAAKGAM